jgi:hypothetical protein
MTLQDQRSSRKTSHTLKPGDLICGPLVELNRCDHSPKIQELLEHVCCGQDLKQGQDEEHSVIMGSLKHK